MSATLNTLSRRAVMAGARTLRPRKGLAPCTRVSSVAATVAARQEPQHLPLLRPAQLFNLTDLLTPPARRSATDEDAAASPARAGRAAGVKQGLPVFQRPTSVVDVVSDLRVLKAVAQVKLFGLPSQVKGTLPAGYHASATAGVREAATIEGDLEFCCESLDRVSRSFSAVIRQLPPSVAVPTCAFYLVLRALDTVEDEMDFRKFSAASARVLRGAAATATVARDPLLFKTSCLLSFHRLLVADDDADARAAWATLEALNAANVGEGNDQELLLSFDKVARVLREHCTPAQREIVADVTRQMATGMAEYVQRDLGVDGTRDRADLDRYCHIVAGLVGEGLSRLWATAEGSGIPAKSLRAVTAETGLGSLSSDMGLFLQKANIIRDYAEDQVDGRAFWPKDVWGAFSPTGRLGAFLDVNSSSANANGAGLACLNSMVNDALSLAPSCFEYLRHLAPGDARILRFCAIPQVMALCTLAECYANANVFRGVVKTPKTQSARICCEVGDMAGVLSWYTDVCDDLDAKAVAWERSPAFDAARGDARVAAETRARVAALRAAVLQHSKEQPVESDDDEEEIPENWPCGPHCAASVSEAYLVHQLAR
jgi:farnesyl-diphosphate farnesyltransferase